MLQKIFKQSFANAVHTSLSRNIRLSSWDMGRAAGTKRTDSLAGPMSGFPHQVSHSWFRNPRSNQSRQSFVSEWIWIWFGLHFSSDQSHPNIQLCSWRIELSFHPSDKIMEIEWKALWSSSRSQQIGDSLKAWKVTSANLEKKLRYSPTSSWYQWWKTS